jgi:secondary thiamine-phosphate synthase enzyme
VTDEKVMVKDHGLVARKSVFASTDRSATPDGLSVERREGKYLFAFLSPLATATKQFDVPTRKEGDVVDLTGRVREFAEGSKILNGVVTVFVSGSTAAITTVEFEPGLAEDLPAALERISPKDIAYEHSKTWGDSNGHSHVKASLVGPGLTVPLVDGRLTLGTWQQVVLLELDTRARNRRVVVQIVGE